DPYGSPVRRELDAMGGHARMDPADDARVPEVRRVQADDGRGRLAQGDPEVVSVRAEVEVVSQGPDEESAHDRSPLEVDHDHVAAACVGDVGVPIAGRDRGDLGPTEVAEHPERAKTAPAEQRHAAVRVHDDRRTVQRRSHHKRVLDANTPEYVAAVRPERDGEDLVRGFGDDERDGPPAGRRGNGGGEEERNAYGRESEDLAHAWCTPAGRRTVPRELRFSAPRGVAQPG